jgi:pimeloyl-ACP methyl ester carboxylesterase
MLLDAVYPGIHRTFLPSYRSPWHEGGTLVDMAASERATKGGPNLGSTPLVVITAGDPAKATSWADRKWNAEQDQAAALSTNSRHWYAKKSGHVIQQDQPAIVLSGLRWLLGQVR